jgi:hypothetical protein
MSEFYFMLFLISRFPFVCSSTRTIVTTIRYNLNEYHINRLDTSFIQ